MAKSPMPKNLNICLVARKFPLLGRAADHGFLWPVARGLAQRGHQVTVLSWKNPKAETFIERDNVKAYFLGEGFTYSTKKYQELVEKKFIELHRQQKFHIVHSLDSGGFNIALKKKKLRIPVAYDVEATQLSQIFSILGYAQETLTSLLRTAVAVSYKFLTTYLGSDRKILKTANVVFVTSPQQKLALERYYLFPEKRIYLVPYGIEIGDLSPREKSDEVRMQMGIPANGRVVVTITDMTEIEEVKTLLKAFEKLAIKKPASRLIIVGQGPLKKQIEFEMLNLALGSKVIFTGAVSNAVIADYIALADIFVNLSARTSGFEPSILEAMAQKKVIIGSEVSPISTIVDHGKNGFLLRPADNFALSQLLIRICSDELPSVEIGENARNRVMHIFDISRMLDQTLAAYEMTLLHSKFYTKTSS